MEAPSMTKMTLATSRNRSSDLPVQKPMHRIMYGEESRGVPLYINNYGKADHGGGRPQVCKKSRLSSKLILLPTFLSRG